MKKKSFFKLIAFLILLTLSICGCSVLNSLTRTTCGPMFYELHLKNTVDSFKTISIEKSKLEIGVIERKKSDFFVVMVIANQDTFDVFNNNIKIEWNNTDIDSVITTCWNRNWKEINSTAIIDDLILTSEFSMMDDNFLISDSNEVTIYANSLFQINGESVKIEPITFIYYRYSE
jgi:hypothetical protein